MYAYRECRTFGGGPIEANVEPFSDCLFPHDSRNDASSDSVGELIEPLLAWVEPEGIIGV